MAQLRMKRNFKSLSDQMGVWISEYQGKIRVHFRQVSESVEPKKHYLFIEADKLTSLQTACLHAELEEFKSYVVDEYQTVDGDAYVTELVLPDREHSPTLDFKPVHMLQRRNLKYETGFNFVTISNMEEFKSILEKVHVAYDKMTVEKPKKEADDQPKPKPKRPKTLAARRGKTLKPLQLFPELSNNTEDELTRSGFPQMYQPISPFKNLI